MSPEELDYVAAVCLDPSIPSKWRQVMEPCMDRRREWLKTMMPKGLQVSVAFEKADVVKASLGFKNSKFLGMAMHGVFPEGLIEYLPIKIAPEPVKGRNSLFVDCIWVVPPFCLLASAWKSPLNLWNGAFIMSVFSFLRHSNHRKSYSISLFLKSSEPSIWILNHTPIIVQKGQNIRLFLPRFLD